MWNNVPIGSAVSWDEDLPINPPPCHHLIISLIMTLLPPVTGGCSTSVWAPFCLAFFSKLWKRASGRVCPLCVCVCGGGGGGHGSSQGHYGRKAGRSDNSHFFFFRAAPSAYGGSQTWGRIGAEAAGLPHSPAPQDLSCICDLHLSLWQCQVLKH